MTALTPELRLEWRRTWADHTDDFTARDPVHGGFCRVYRYPAAGRDEWQWVANEAHRAIAQGLVPTAKEAALAAEHAYWTRFSE